MKRLLMMVSLPCVLALAVHPAGARADAPELEPVPEVALAGTPDSVRTAVEQAFARVGTVGADPARLAEAYGDLGDVLFVHEFLAQARAAYRNAARLQPHRPEWEYLLGLLEYNEGDLDRALLHFDRVLERDSRNHLARVRRGRVLLHLGQPEAAWDDFAAALESNPGSAAALAGLGKVALDRGEYRQAADFLESALESSPGASRLHHQLGMAYRGMGLRSLAEEHLKLGGDEAETLEDPLLDRVYAASRSPQFYLELGLERAGQGDLESSRMLLDTAYRLAPDDTRVLFNYGDVLARLERFDEAQAVFSRLVEVDGGTAEHHFYLGQVEEVRGAAGAAAAAYGRALALDEGHDRAREALAYLRLAQGEFRKAAADFARLAERAAPDERRIRHRYWQGLARLGSGDCKGAAETLERARAEAESFIGPVMNALARVRATCAGADADALREALEWAAALYDADPGLETAATLAMVHAALGRFDDAVDFQAQALFEAVKAGQLDRRTDLQANMARYREGRPADRPFAPDDPVYSMSLAERRP